MNYFVACSHLIRCCFIHLYISFHIISCAIWFIQIASSCLLQDTIRLHGCACWLKECCISFSNQPGSSNLGIVIKVGTLLWKWVLNIFIALSANIFLRCRKVVGSNLLLTVRANNANCISPTFQCIWVCVQPEASFDLLQEHVRDSSDRSVASWQVFWATSNRTLLLVWW